MPAICEIELELGPLAVMGCPNTTAMYLRDQMFVMLVLEHRAPS